MTNFSKRGLSTGFGALLLLLGLAAPFATRVAAVENSNPIAELLSIVQRIETAVTGLTSVGGSLFGLQSDVSAIRTKTDKLPQDTGAVLGEIRARTGVGPLTRTFIHSFLVSTGQTGSITCFSSGPYLVYVNASGINASVQSYLNGSPLHTARVPVATSLTLGGYSGDAVTIELVVGSQQNPNAYGQALVTIQTTEGSIIGCN